jgi:rhodanese-related sulfurtransferase
LSSVRADSSVPVELLEGGFAGWLSATHLSTGPAGVTRERIQGITYDRLVSTNKSDVVLVDVRPPPAAAAAPATAKTRQALASATPLAGDVVSDFAQKLGVPLVGNQANSAAPRVHALATSTPPAAPTLAGYEKAGKLLVLVADDEADANAVARQLRARGSYRFTILIGGTDAIRHEGKIGSTRVTGGTYAGQPEP